VAVAIEVLLAQSILEAVAVAVLQVQRLAVQAVQVE
jgi:hypothetical protein